MPTKKQRTLTYMKAINKLRRAANSLAVFIKSPAHRLSARHAGTLRKGRIQKYGLPQLEEYAKNSPGDASLPEKLVYAWLVKHGIPFNYQYALMGGHVPGGAIVDFVIYLRDPSVILRIMGYYWHNKSPASQINDDLQLESLEDLGYIVEDIWDYEVNTLKKLFAKMSSVIYGMPKPLGLKAAGGISYGFGVCTRCGDPACVRYCNGS